MNKKTVAIVMLVVGVVLLALGFNELGTFGSRAGRLLGAGLSNTVLFYFIAGGLCAAFGLLQMRRK